MIKRDQARKTNLKYFLGFNYKSGYPSYNADIPADAAWYVPGVMEGNLIKHVPGKQSHSEPYWLAGSANPGGEVSGHDEFTNAFDFSTRAIDGIPFYWVLGSASYADGSWTILGSTSGAPSNLIGHVENRILPAYTAREFEDVRCEKATISGKDGFLTVEMQMLPRREYSMNDGVVAMTNAPIARGSQAPTGGTDIFYKIQGNAGLTLTWNTHDLQAAFLNFTSVIENPIRNVPLEDNNLYYGLQQTWGNRKYLPPMFTLGQTPDTNIGNLEYDRDVKTQSTLLMKIPRRHANDYIEIAWTNVRILQVLADPTPLNSLGNITILFSTPTFIIVVEHLANSSGTSTPNAAADYEQ